jgi:hypothetical protein
MVCDRHWLRRLQRETEKKMLDDQKWRKKNPIYKATRPAVNQQKKINAKQWGTETELSARQHTKI